MENNLEIIIKEIEKASPIFASLIRDASSDEEKCKLIASSLKFHINSLKFCLNKHV